MQRKLITMIRGAVTETDADEDLLVTRWTLAIGFTIVHR